MAMGSASDAAALENIRAVQNVATSRGDNAMTVFASILEGLALLKTSKDSNIERVQSCIAQVAKFQFDPTVKIMQLEMLTLVLDFASSLYRQSPDTTAQKLRLLQQKLDACEEWNNVKADFLIPVKKQPSNTRPVSEETSAIIRLAGEGDGDVDFIVMSFMTKVELRSLVYVHESRRCASFANLILQIYFQWTGQHAQTFVTRTTLYRVLARRRQDS